MIEYWNSVKRNFLFIFLISVLMAVLAYWVADRQAVVNEVHFSYLVALQQRDDNNNYRFDGFYALQSTDSFASTLAHWITTPEVVAAAYQESDLVLTTEDPRQVTKIISANQTAPQLVEVVIKHENKDKGVALAEALQVVVERKIDTYHDEGIPAISFNAVPGDMWTGKTALSVPVITTGVFIITFLFSLNALLMLVSLKKIKD